MSDPGIAIFAVYGLGSQAVLLAYFAARSLRPGLAERYGWVAYATGLAGLAAGSWLAVEGESWRLVTGPFLFAAWAAFGGWADLVSHSRWRRPVRWPIFGPYVTLYLAAQMFMWWPLWDLWRTGWAVYLVLFALNTGLNLSGHVAFPAGRPRQA